MSSQDYDSDDFTITHGGVYGQEEIEVESAGVALNSGTRNWIDVMKDTGG